MIAAAPERAAAPPHIPAQLALAGVPAPEYPLRVAIAGYLQRAAELRISTDGRAHLVVEVLQPRDAAHGGLPFVAAYHADAEPATRARLEALAAQMLPDSAVVLTGHGLQLGEHLGEPVLRVLRCDKLDALAPGEAARFFDSGTHEARP